MAGIIEGIKKIYSGDDVMKKHFTFLVIIFFFTICSNSFGIAKDGTYAYINGADICFYSTRLSCAQSFAFGNYLKQQTEFDCGPYAGANAVLRLGINEDPQKVVFELSEKFKCSKRGVTSANLCGGLDEYLKSKGYHSNVQYCGYRPVCKKYKFAEKPELSWIKKEMENNKQVILNIGVYKKELKNGKTIYKRQYGHYVNAAGFGFATEGLTISDPYDKNSDTLNIILNRINEGKFVHNKGDDETALTDDANGFYEISPKFSYFKKNEVAVLNGAVSVAINRYD
ncbi:MAG: hypothetical protein LBK53_07660 [Heliobacteriaceae bacterium]|jgi:hypothetical protein|nr:hypothetical protein [Heliobacteriaceae bacterium]